MNDAMNHVSPVRAQQVDSEIVADKWAACREARKSGSLEELRRARAALRDDKRRFADKYSRPA